jgi:hypothetical protein
MAVFVPQQLIWLIEKEIIWSALLKVFILWLFLENFC